MLFHTLSTSFEDFCCDSFALCPLSRFSYVFVHVAGACVCIRGCMCAGTCVYGCVYLCAHACRGLRLIEGRSQPSAKFQSPRCLEELPLDEALPPSGPRPLEDGLHMRSLVSHCTPLPAPRRPGGGCESDPGASRAESGL